MSEGIYKIHPEIFPMGTGEGYCLNGSQPPSVKTGITLRRIRLKATGETWSVHPSFVMPYMTALTDEVEAGLFIMSFGVPNWALTHAFGYNDMFRYRIGTGFGRNSTVGTTVREPGRLPGHVSADEKHTRMQSEKVFTAATVADGCTLGIEISERAGAEELEEAYGTFAEEALDVSAEYSPKTVNTDGWEATGKAWNRLFPGIQIIICFLHAFLSIRRVCGRKYDGLLKMIGEKVWDVCGAKTKRSFSQKIRRLREWAVNNLQEGHVLSKIRRLCSRRDSFIPAYDYAGAHRTSNMIDRLMRWQDEFLFNRKYFHGNIESARLAIRSWALIRNFRPYCSRITGEEKISAAIRLNGFSYSENWLENLLVSSSMGGYRK